MVHAVVATVTAGAAMATLCDVSIGYSPGWGGSRADTGGLKEPRGHLLLAGLGLQTATTAPKLALKIQTEHT